MEIWFDLTLSWLNKGLVVIGQKNGFNLCSRIDFTSIKCKAFRVGKVVKKLNC